MSDNCFFQIIPTCFHNEQKGAQCQEDSFELFTEGKSQTDWFLPFLQKCILRCRPVLLGRALFRPPTPPTRLRSSTPSSTLPRTWPGALSRLNTRCRLRWDTARTFTHNSRLSVRELVWEICLVFNKKWVSDLRINSVCSTVCTINCQAPGRFLVLSKSSQLDLQYNYVNGNNCKTYMIDSMVWEVDQ